MQINEFIFNAELEEILAEIRYELQASQIPLLQKEPKPSRNSLQIQCPYHGNGQERNRSAGIRKSDGMFHCFTCGEIHTLPEVISYCFGYTDDISGAYGWKWLLRNFATIKVEERKDIVLDCVRYTSRDSHNNSNFVERQELEKYRWVHKYMYARGLTDEIIDKFDIGYDSATKCITFPVFDIHGNCLFVARRSVKAKFYKYPEGVEKPLYGIYELSCEPEYPQDVIVCESMLDALTCWVYGKYAVAMNGLGNELCYKQLRQLPCRHLILATDNDNAGKRARLKLRANVTNKLITEYILPEGKKDINELTKEEFDALEEIF